MDGKRIRSLGNVMQLAYVPSNLDAALDYWINRMGVGPFFRLEHAQHALDEATYRGLPCEADFTMLLAYWGDLQIELIQQHNDAPSIYKDWRDQRGEGLHHTCILVEDLTIAVDLCTRAGATFLQDGRSGGSSFAYMDTKGGPGTILEMLCPAPEVLAYQAHMKECARTWDGSDPLRPFGS
jgi:methylmalonyl-CoA/ethylmalonyl-CoA epimerase